MGSLAWREAEYLMGFLSVGSFVRVFIGWVRQVLGQISHRLGDEFSPPLFVVHGPHSIPLSCPLRMPLAWPPFSIAQKEEESIFESQGANHNIERSE